MLTLLISNRNSYRQIGQKVCVNKLQIVEQVVVTIEENMTSENTGTMPRITPCFPLLQVFLILVILQSCAPTSTDIFCNDRD